MSSCKYCDESYQRSERTLFENDRWFSNLDKHPVNPGHMKIIPKRHVNSVAELTANEWVSLGDMLSKAKESLAVEFHPDGYNLGINEGEASGQTVFHLHIHYIPRYKGDMENPAGGVRNIIPGKGDYRKEL